MRTRQITALGAAVAIAIAFTATASTVRASVIRQQDQQTSIIPSGGSASDASYTATDETKSIGAFEKTLAPATKSEQKAPTMKAADKKMTTGEALQQSAASGGIWTHSGASDTLAAATETAASISTNTAPAAAGPPISHTYTVTAPGDTSTATSAAFQATTALSASALACPK